MRRAFASATSFSSGWKKEREKTQLTLGRKNNVDSFLSTSFFPLFSFFSLSPSFFLSLFLFLDPRRGHATLPKHLGVQRQRPQAVRGIVICSCERGRRRTNDSLVLIPPLSPLSLPSLFNSSSSPVKERPLLPRVPRVRLVELIRAERRHVGLDAPRAQGDGVERDEKSQVLGERRAAVLGVGPGGQSGDQRRPRQRRHPREVDHRKEEDRPVAPPARVGEPRPEQWRQVAGPLEDHHLDRGRGRGLAHLPGEIEHEVGLEAFFFFPFSRGGRVRERKRKRGGTKAREQKRKKEGGRNVLSLSPVKGQPLAELVPEDEGADREQRGAPAARSGRGRDRSRRRLC